MQRKGTDIKGRRRGKGKKRVKTRRRKNNKRQETTVSRSREKRAQGKMDMDAYIQSDSRQTPVQSNCGKYI